MSKQFAQANHVTREKLETLRQKHEIKLGKLKKAHDEAIKTISALPIPGREVDAQKELEEEIKDLRAQFDAMRLFVQQEGLAQSAMGSSDPSSSTSERTYPSAYGKRKAAEEDEVSTSKHKVIEEDEASSKDPFNLDSLSGRLDDLEWYVQQRPEDDRAIIEKRTDEIIQSALQAEAESSPPPIPPEIRERIRQYVSKLDRIGLEVREISTNLNRLVEAEQLLSEHDDLKARIQRVRSE